MDIGLVFHHTKDRNAVRTGTFFYEISYTDQLFLCSLRGTLHTIFNLNFLSGVK
jgi:hypothetical protein